LTNIRGIFKFTCKKPGYITLDNQQLTAIFKETHARHFPGKMKKISAEFYPYRSIKHTIKWNALFINVKISNHFINAPVSVIEITALLLLARVYRFKVNSYVRRTYNRYVERLQQQLPERKKRKIGNYNPQGSCYDLRIIFNQLNQNYFNNSLQIKNIGWSKKISYRRLGFYNEERDLLVISKIFDSEKVPEEVITYLVYHEMLHILLPMKKRNGRRIIHAKRFKELEKQYPAYNRINKWIKTNLIRL
jgi:predicted metal-dependent hydrolase